MIGKKINQLATELAPVSTDLTIIGDPISGVSKKITLAQLGAIFSGAVSFYTNLAGFPATGDINVIYCAKDTQKLYLWSGSAYVEVFPSQALLDTYQLRSEKGVSNGYASLDSTGKVPISQLPSSIMEYKGTWNAATNTPTLSNGTGDTGDVYICNVAGTVNFGAGPITFAVGDYVIYSGTIWQRSSGAVGTVTSVGLSITGDSIGVSNSPITTSGTLALAFAGTSSQYINGAGNLTTFPTLTGFVPYTGATANVDLGTFDLTADILTAATGSYTSSGGGNTLEISHTSGSGIALNITKGGNGEGLYINKTSGTGNAATIVGTLEATTLVKTGGTSSQFLKADGSVDSSTYVTTDTFQTISASKTFSVGLSLASAGGTNQLTSFINTSSLFSGSGGSNVLGFNSANNIYFGKGLDNGGVLQWNNSAVRYYTLPDATGTIALVGGAGVGTVTSVGLSSATSGVTIGSTPITTSGTITLAIATASGSQQGLLSSTDWTTFNNKQNALTNPVTGTGTTNYLPKFTGTTTIGNSIVQDDGSTLTIGGALSGRNATFTSSTANIGIIGTGTFSYLQLAHNGGATKYSYLVATNDGMLDIESNIVKFTDYSGASERMRINASGNVSIGNTNDTYKLDVSGVTRINTSTQNIALIINGIGRLPTIAFESSGTGKAYIQVNGSNDLNFLVNDGAVTALSLAASTGAATFSSSVTATYGYFSGTGAGAFNSQVILNNTTSSPALITFQNTANGHAFGFNSTGTSRFTFINGGLSEIAYITSTGAATFSSSVTAGGIIRSGSSGVTQGQLTLFSSTANAEGNIYGRDGGGLLLNTNGNNYPIVLNGSSILLNPVGNVGIGTTSPAATLQVRGDNGTSVSAVMRLRDTNSTARTTRLQFEDYAGAYADGLIDFKIPTAGTASGARLDLGVDSAIISLVRGGNVGIGTTSPGEKLEVNGNIKTAAPSGGSAGSWKLGTFTSGSATIGGKVRVEINGVAYDLLTT